MRFNLGQKTTVKLKFERNFKLDFTKRITGGKNPKKYFLLSKENYM